MKSLMFIASGAVFAAALAASGPVAAGPVVPVPGDATTMQTTVVLGDLDLNRVSGAETAAMRIRRAAKKVCDGNESGLYPLGLKAATRTCAAASLRDALSRLDHPMVTRAAYGEKAPAIYAAR